MVRHRKQFALIVHAARVTIVVVLLALLPSPRSIQDDLEENGRPPELSLVQRSLPQAAAISDKSTLDRLWAISDGSGQTIAYAARTLPESADVIGYRGPSEALILIDKEFKLVAVDLIASEDTDEHVRAVVDNQPFFDQFQGWSWSGLSEQSDIEGVSGATLTSMAFAKGVLRRMGGDRPSLVFPDECTADEVQRWFEDASVTVTEFERTKVFDEDSVMLGQVIRTGPLSDTVVGYQGPTELLLRIESEPQSDGPANRKSDLVRDIQIRSSFDNEPYVGYCKTEYGFWKLFKGKSVESLASLDLEQEGVEGVSGATMTSMAIAETLVEACRQLDEREQKRAERLERDKRAANPFLALIDGVKSLQPSDADWGCVALLICIPLLRNWGWFRKQWFRKAWLVSTISIVGLWSGNLISLALISGWSVEGVAWRLAPALSAVLIIAVLSPPVGKSNPYCNHLCPHGAAQQLLKPGSKSKRRWKPPRRLLSILAYLPGTLLVSAYLLLQIRPHTDLSSWEPFHAYLFRIAPWSALAFACLTLAASSMIPMGYCRFGCPTGRLLDYLRRSGSSQKLTWADAVAFSLLIVAGYLAM